MVVLYKQVDVNVIVDAIDMSSLTPAYGTRLLKLVQFYSDHAMLHPNLRDQPVQPK